MKYKIYDKKSHGEVKANIEIEGIKITDKSITIQFAKTTASQIHPISLALSHEEYYVTKG